MKKNIAIDIRSLMSPNYSGVSFYTFFLIKNILKKDNENNYFLFFNSFSKKYPDYIKELVKFPNTSIVHTKIPNKIFNFLQKVFSFPKVDKLIFRKTKKKIDLILMPNINFLALGNTRLLVVIHDLSFLIFKEFFDWRRRLWHFFIDIKKLVKKSELIAVSKNTKRDIINYLEVSPDKINLIYPGLNKYEDNSPNIELSNGFKIDERFILFFGNLEPRKNIESIITAFEIFCEKFPQENYKLVLLGAKSWKFQSILRKYKNSVYKDRIIFLGYLKEDEKNQILKKASLVIFPSFYEGFGFPILEAMHYGIPLICSSISSMGEVSNTASILIDPFNISDLLIAIENILFDNDLRDSLIAKEKKEAEKFSWDKAVDEFLKLI